MSASGTSRHFAAPQKSVAIGDIADTTFGAGLYGVLNFRLCELLHTRSDDFRTNHKGQMSNLGRNLLIAIITAVICGILLYAAIRY
jgi:hypothetical protein